MIGELYLCYHHEKFSLTQALNVFWNGLQDVLYTSLTFYQLYYQIATLSDDNTMRVWRATKRLGLKGLGALIGTAERVSKDIGNSDNK